MGTRSLFLPRLNNGFVVKKDQNKRNTNGLSVGKVRRDAERSHAFDDGSCIRCGFELVELAVPASWIKHCI